MPTKIQWTQEVWNPVTGCDKVSQGCKNCYAEVMHRRLMGMFPKKYSKPFLGTIEMHPEEIETPLKWSSPKMIFVNSMSDLFHKDISALFIRLILNTMEKCPQHIFQVLTKRPEIAHEHFTNNSMFIDRIPDNLWLGVSCEDQKTADERVPILIDIPVKTRFLSCEPLLGPIDLMKYLYNVDRTIHQVIVGGESGNKARPMHPNWARSLRDQCRTTDTPFFFKQWGSWHESDLDEGTGVGIKRRHLFPDGKLMYKIGKKASGALLDGIEHLYYPK